MSWLSDTRYALRALTSAPAFAVTAVLTMALGIGANTGIFSVLNGLMLRDLPVPSAHELVDIFQEVRGIRRGNSGYGNGFATYEYEFYRDSTQTLSGIAAFGQTVPSVLGGESAREVPGGPVSCNYFGVLRQQPVLGPGFSPNACLPGGPSAEVVLSHELWVDAFGADEAVLDTDILLNGQRFSVVGVAPEGFRGIDFVRSSFFVPLNAQSLLSVGSDLVASEISWLNLVGRIGPSFNRERVVAELAVLARQIDQEQPGRETTLTVNRATTFGPPIMLRFFAGPFLSLAGFVLVLVIACSNVATLILVHGEARTRDRAVRLALGATSRRLIRQLLLESVMISVVGGLIGTILSLWVFQWLSVLVLSSMGGTIGALQLDPSPDARVLVFALALSVGTGIVAGLAPAHKMSKPDLRTAIESDSAATGHSTRGRLQSVIIAVQVALSMVLIVATGLLLRGFAVAQQAELGYDHQGLTVASVDLARFGYDVEQAAEFQRRWVERIEGLPGVEAVAQAAIPPLSTNLSRWTFFDVLTTTNAVSANYFSVAGIPIVRGRTFTEVEERREQNTAVVVSESTARRFWPGENPLGQTLTFPRVDADEEILQVVGVAADMQVQRIGETDTPYIYTPAIPRAQARLRLLIRSSLEATALNRAVSAIVRDIDPALLAQVAALEANVDFWRRLSRMTVGLSLGLGALALVLASIGVFGVMSSAVGRRIREIGIRLAIGAGAVDVLALVLRKSLKPVLVGLGIGTLACVLAGRAMSSMLFGVSPFDPYALAGALFVVLAAGIVAGVIPARRALRVEPMTTLRHD
jgi:predicted permease